MAYISKARRNRAEEAPGALIASQIQREKQGIMPYTMLFVVIAIGFHLGEFIFRSQEPDEASRLFAGNNLYYLGLAAGGFGAAMVSAGFTFGFITPGFKFLGTKDKFFNGKAIQLQLSLSVGITVVVLAVFGFILKPIFATISPIERIIFYGTGAISEELWYRFFVQNTATGLLRKIPIKAFDQKTTSGYLLPGIIALIPSGLYFMSAHAEVYANNPAAFIGTFFSGTAFGLGLLVSNNILIAIVPHVINNVFTAFWDLFLPKSMTGAVLSIQFVFAAIFVAFIACYACFKKKNKNANITDQKLTTDVVAPSPSNAELEAKIKRKKRIINVICLVVITVLVIEILFGNIFFSWYIMQTGPP